PDSVQNDIERIRNLNTDVLDRLHRFTRLLRRLTWSIPELDLVLVHFAQANLAPTLNEAALRRLVDVLAVGERWNIPVEQNCALWSEFPKVSLAEDKAPLFDRLFNLPSFVRLDGTLPKDAVKFIHPAFRTSGAPTPADTTLGRLLAGLQISNDQLAQLITQLSAPLGVNLGTNNEADRGFLMTRANLALLYRHARLMQLLKLSVAELVQLIGQAALAGGHVQNLGALMSLVEFYDWLKTSSIKLDEVGYITGGLVRQPEAFPNRAEMAAQIVASIQSEKALQF